MSMIDSLHLRFGFQLPAEEPLGQSCSQLEGQPSHDSHHERLAGFDTRQTARVGYQHRQIENVSTEVSFDRGLLRQPIPTAGRSLNQRARRLDQA